MPYVTPAKQESEIRHSKKKFALVRHHAQEEERKLGEFVQKHVAEISQKQKELDAALTEINRLKEWQKEHLQDFEKNVHMINEKDPEIA